MDGLWSILPIVLEIAVPALVVLIGWGIRALVKKLGAEEHINVDDLIDQIVARAVNGVEQLDIIAIKRHEKAMDSGDKLASAISLIEKELQHYNLPKMASSLLRMRVEAYLCSLAIEKTKGD